MKEIIWVYCDCVWLLDCVCAYRIVCVKYTYTQQRQLEIVELLGIAGIRNNRIMSVLAVTELLGELARYS